MYRGEIIEQAAVDDFFHNPKQEYSRRLIDALPDLTHFQSVAVEEPLLRLEDVKVHFPIRKGVLQRVVDYTRAVDGVSLSIGRGELITIPGSMADVFVANENIADVQIKSQRQLYVFGKAGGQTTIYASNAGGDIVWSANVRVGSNLDSIDQMLTLAMPDAKVNVSTMGTNTVLLTGIIAAPEDASEAERLVQAFVGEDTNVISRLRMATPLQVNLRVRFAEVSRSLVRALGANLLSADSSSGFKFGVSNGRGNAFPQYSPGGPLGVGVTTGTGGTSVVTSTGTGSTIAAFGKFLGLDIGGALDLAERDGLVTTLSQPNLTALSGETADFLAGGEFPIPIAQGLGVDPVHFGLITVMAIEIGLLTPPLGISVFVVASSLKGTGVELRDVFIGAAPFAGIMAITLLLLIEFPIIVTAILGR